MAIDKKKKTTAKKDEATLVNTKSRDDGYVDIAKKIGQKVSGNTGFMLSLIDDTTAAALYIGNGLAKRYIDLLVSDMTRQWINIPEDTDGKLLKYFKKLKAKKEFKNALRCSKLFGGAIIFMVIDDGQAPNIPVNVNAIKSIKKLKHFSRKYVTIDSMNYYNDPTSENYGDPQFFTITTAEGGVVTVHESRCLIFNGEYYPADELSVQPAYDKYWGLSILQSLHEILEDYGLALQSLLKLLTKSNVDVLKIENLMALLSNPDGQAQLDARAQTFDLAKSVSTTLLLDEKEAYETVSQALTGVAETFGKLQETIAAMAGVPSNILMGTSIKGLNANGNGEMRIYYDKIKSNQEEELLPPAEKLALYVSLAQDAGVDSKEEYDIGFNPLWQQTDDEKVLTRQNQAKTDEIYINSGVLDPNEVRDSRFGNGHYSIETDAEGPAPILPEATVVAPTKPVKKK